MQKEIHDFLVKNTITDEDYPIAAMENELSTTFLSDISAKVNAYLESLQGHPTRQEAMNVAVIATAFNEFAAFYICTTMEPVKRIKGMLDALRIMWRTAGL